MTKKQKEEEADHELSFDSNIRLQECDISKVCQKYSRVDQNIIDYLNSQHAMQIQNSEYIQIENNRERILRHEK